MDVVLQLDRQLPSVSKRMLEFPSILSPLQ
jgi:hypothetical protein